jgi:polar amino acid transport system substrate-binding protein
MWRGGAASGCGRRDGGFFWRLHDALLGSANDFARGHRAESNIRGTDMKKLAALIGALVLSLVAASTAPSAFAQESQLDVVLKRDKLIVGTYSTSPPLAYIDDSGNLVGLEIDMAHAIAKDLLGDPNKIEFVVLQSDGRFPAALSGKIDFGLCSTTITGDRAVRIAFTRPYLDTGGSIIARRDAGIKTVLELNNSKFTYAILNVPPAIARAK